MAKDVSFVVMYDSDTQTFQTDPDQTDAYFPNGPVWNFETDQAERDFELVNESWRQWNAKFAELETPTSQSVREGLVMLVAVGELMTEFGYRFNAAEVSAQ